MGYGLDRRAETGLKPMTPRSRETIRRRLGLDGIIFRPPATSPPAPAPGHQPDPGGLKSDEVEDQEPQQTPRSTPRRSKRRTPRTMTPRQAAAARDTASSRAKADAVRLALDVHVASNAATASAAASQQMSMARLFRPTRNEAKDLLDLKQRTEKAFADGRRIHRSTSWTAASSGPADGPRAEYWPPHPLALRLPLDGQDSQKPLSFRQMEARRKASENFDVSSLSFRKLQAQYRERAASAETRRESHSTAPKSFRQMEAEVRMRNLGWSESRITRALERPFAAPLLRDNAPTFWNRGLGPPSSWPAWQAPYVSRFRTPNMTQHSPSERQRREEGAHRRDVWPRYEPVFI